MKETKFKWNQKDYQLLYNYDRLTNKINYIFSEIYRVKHGEHGVIEAAQSITNGIIDKDRYDVSQSIINHLISKNYLPEAQDTL